MRPELPTGWFYPGDISVYRYVFTALIPEGGHAVEVGVWRGRALMSVADLIVKRHIKVTAIDSFEPYRGDTATDRLEQLHRTAVQFGIADYLQICKGYSVSMAANFPNDFLDFVFIGADHSYQAVHDDILAWIPKVKLGGYLGGHDFATGDPGVVRAVAEMFTEVITWPQSRIWLTKRNS